jgi:polar amino acid transport system permease protein
VSSNEQPSAGPLDEGSRRSRLVGDLWRQEGAKAVAVAVVSTVIVLGGILYVVLHSQYWPDFKQAFFSRDAFVESFPDVLEAFRRNVWPPRGPPIICCGLVLAVLRSLRGPVFFPLGSSRRWR